MSLSCFSSRFLFAALTLRFSSLTTFCADFTALSASAFCFASSSRVGAVVTSCKIGDDFVVLSATALAEKRVIIDRPKTNFLLNVLIFIKIWFIFTNVIIIF